MALSKPTGGKSLFSRLNLFAALKSFLQNNETTKPGETFELFLKSMSKPTSGRSFFSRLNPFAAVKSFSIFTEQTPSALSSDTGQTETSKSVKLDPQKLGIGSPMTFSCNVAKGLLSEGQMESSKLVKLDPLKFGIRSSMMSQDSYNVVKTLQSGGQMNNSKFFKLDSLKFGIRSSMVSRDSYNVVKALQSAGFEAYLVGGCVRDLLLKRIPKDFDVITTAKLDKVKQKFRRAIIVGERFPVCRVTLKHSVVEVTSFGTVDKQITTKQLSKSCMPAGCELSDYTRWNDSMRRDFTINSLFYDPLGNKIFDYTNAMMDLRFLKLSTIKPAISSFKEDKARILRGLRLAARLNLTFSKETEAAIYDLSPSVVDICKARLNMEINYMLSYGAAESSLLLLKRFKLLEILLPFQDAYLCEKLDNQHDPRQSMLLKLYSNMDRLITCDRPCDGSLWVALLTFHLALFNNPQPAEVVLTFASLLYHGTWERSIKFARQYAPAAQIYSPEISISSDSLSDDEIAERVVKMAVQVNHSINVLIDPDSLLKAMARFPESPRSRLVLVSSRMGQRVEAIFKILANDVTFFKDGKRVQEIDYGMLGDGNTAEMRFVLGQIILNTLVPVNVAEREVAKLQKGDMRVHEPIADRVKKGEIQENGPITESGVTKVKKGDIQENRPITERGVTKVKKGDMQENMLNAESGVTKVETKQDNRLSAESGVTKVKTKQENRLNAESGVTKVKKNDIQENLLNAESGVTKVKKSGDIQENRPTTARGRTKVKKGEMQENRPITERGVTKAKKGDAQENGPIAERGAKVEKDEIHEVDIEIEQLLGEVLKQTPHSPTDLRKGDSTPSANDLWPQKAGMADIFSGSSRKLENKNSDLFGHSLAPVDVAEREVPNVKIGDIQENMHIAESGVVKVKKIDIQENRLITERGVAKGKKGDLQENRPITQRGVTKVQKGDTLENDIGQLLEVLQQIPCSSTDLKKGDSALKNGNKRSISPSTNDLLRQKTGKVKIFSGSSRKMGNKSSDLSIRSLATEKIDKDKDVRVEVERAAPSLSSLFK